MRAPKAAILRVMAKSGRAARGAAPAPPPTQPLTQPSALSVLPDGRLAVRLHVRPGAHRSAVVPPTAASGAAGPGDDAGVISVAVAAPPRDGEANGAVVALVAEVLGVRPRCVSLVAGARSREKVVAVEWPHDIAAARLRFQPDSQ